MKKITEYNDKYGKVVTKGEVVEERTAPGVSLAEEPKNVEDVLEPNDSAPVATKSKTSKKE